MEQQEQVFNCCRLYGQCIDLCASYDHEQQEEKLASNTENNKPSSSSAATTTTTINCSLPTSEQFNANQQKSFSWSLTRSLDWLVIDLRQQQQDDVGAIEGPQQQQQHQEDVDGGYAWIILAAMFLINASTFGTARAYGLIFEKLAREDEQGRVEAALPFTIMGAVENMAGPLAGYLLARTNSWRITVLIGASLLTLSHLLAAFYTSLLGQTLAIGLMCGLGLSLVTISSFQINNAYFVKYRSRAFGLGLTGAVFGTLYITPICQYILDNCTSSACYLMLSIILFPNVPLSLLLRPKARQPAALTMLSVARAAIEPNMPPISNISAMQQQQQQQQQQHQEQSIRQLSSESSTQTGGLVKQRNIRFWSSIKQVVGTPYFHLIWPTQLLFCWFNFVYGMIIVDFGYDRGLEAKQCSRLIPIWAFGQLIGRVVLGSLVDLKLASYRGFTVICFGSISMATWALVSLKDGPDEAWLIPSLLFTISVFVATLYILFNGLMFKHLHESLTAFGLGISSFAGSFFLLPRANVIGYYRDTVGSYDPMLSMFASVSLLAALMWLLMPSVFSLIEQTSLDDERCKALRPRTCSLQSASSIIEVNNHGCASASNSDDNESVKNAPPTFLTQ